MLGSELSSADALEQLHQQASAALFLSETGGTLTADGTEQDLLRVTEPLGCWKPLVLMVDLDNMAGGDTTVVRVYYRLRDGGGLQLQSYNSYVGADGGLANNLKVVAIALHPDRHGFLATLEQSAGVNRDYDWKISAEVAP